MPPPLETTGGPEITSGPTPTTIMTSFDPSSSSTGGTSSTGSDACEDDALYRAIWLPGGLDRVVVFRRDDTAGTCAWISLAWPMKNSPYEIPPADGWAVEQILSNDTPSSCDGDNPSMAGAAEVTEAQGVIVVDRGGAASACEVAMDIVAELNFAAGSPQSVEMCPSPIEIAGC